ncbi:MAG: xanthine dehydrogenase family protein molybdopterin-binding subunit, partial [Candidatus Solibacter sp.]
MSLKDSVFQTIAKHMSDPEPDRLPGQHRFLGQPYRRVDGEAKITGRARFTAEYDFPDLAHAALVCSTIASGRIRNIDTERAKGEPGVLEVLTHRNMPEMKAPPLVDLANLSKGMAASDL